MVGIWRKQAGQIHKPGKLRYWKVFIQRKITGDVSMKTSEYYFQRPPIAAVALY